PAGPRGIDRAGARRRPRPRSGAALPDLRLDVPLGLHEDVDQGPVVDVLRVDVGGHAALEQLAALLDLLRHHLEQAVVGDAIEDLRLVVEGEVRGDGARQLAGALRAVDESGHRLHRISRPPTRSSCRPWTSSSGSCVTPRSHALEGPMIDLERNSRFLAAVAITIAVVTATYIGASRWEHVRNKPKERSLKVTGSAKKRIMSDLAEWSATITVDNPDRTAAYRSVHEQMQKTIAFLASKGFKDDVRPSSVEVRELSVTQAVTVRSTDVPKVERISREVTDLLDQGVSIESSAPAYYYTKLGDLKIEMLASASKDARNRADNIVKSAGGG